MRYSVILITLLIILFSCKTSLVVSDVAMDNISNDSLVFASNNTISELVRPYRENLEGDMSKVISISSEEFTKAKPESKLTNLVADMLLNSGIAYCRLSRQDFSPSVAYVNYGGLRVSLPRGEITVGNIYELMPFENEMVMLKLSGETMEKFVQQIAARGGDGVAGMRLGIVDDGIGQLEVDGKAFDIKKDYWVVTNDYVAAGGDDMSMLVNRKEFINTGLKIRDLIIESLEQQHQSGRRIQGKLDGRIYYE
jgi:2',3'-cyclic-nucleotide 2'-phosphodiesterase (5'-nucleotidase family)